MYIPVRTSFVTVHEKEAYPSVNFSYDDDTSIESLMKDIDEYINNRYYHDNKMFRARSYSDTTFIKQVERIMNTVLAGIFFGYYPAKKAADMNPIDALRYE